MATQDDQFIEPTSAEEELEQSTPPQAPPTPPAPTGFGLLFQAPTAVAAPPRRRPEPAVQVDPEPVEDDVDEDEDTSDESDAAQEQASGDDAKDTRDNEQDSSGEESGGSGRRRRRRGGRGRGRSGEDGADGESGSAQGGDSPRGAKGEQGAGDDASGAASTGDSDDSGEDSSAASFTSSEGDRDGDDDGDDSGAGTRRRRRRRRGGNGGGNGGGEQEDPPGTVTKVREGRQDRDEPKAVKGSTRLEAKKQRRREGREAGRRRTIITEAEFLARRESVERVMVVRASEERTQIGVLEDDVLVEHYVSRESTSTMVGNVYLGRVQNVLPSMEAAFVDLGQGRNAVLYAGEVNWEAQGVGNGQARRIENALSSGDSVLVQVTKDPIGHKGARLTSQISLPGRYLVYVPEGSMTGISRKLPDTERARLKSILSEVVPDKAGVIVRTAAEGASEEELRRDVARLTSAWEALKAKADAKQGKKGSAGGAPVVLHAEPDMTVRVIRDIFNEDFSSMVVSGDRAWSQIKGYVDEVAPDLADRLRQHTGERDIFAEHRIDEGIAKAMDRHVYLPSGGSLVIDRTEAMTVVDVNTGKFTGSGGNLEETVTKNNIEAAEEIVRQLRLRDIGGIIVIDFIDMVLESNRDLVVRRLLECLGRDRTKHQVAEVTSLGLVQMTRKRVGSGLIEVFSTECEHCHGRGIVVHDEPVERPDGGDGGSRRGGGSKGERSSGRGRGKGSGGRESAPSEPDGPSAAQIAAAAHAAAIKSIAGEPSEDDVADITDAAAELPVVAEIDGDEDATPARGKGRSRASRSTAGAAPEQPEAAPAATPEPDEARQPRRRGGRRAASSAGAPVALQPVDLTGSAQSAPPRTTLAADAADTSAPAAPAMDPETAMSSRPKRRRVTSQAGPPKPVDED